MLEKQFRVLDLFIEHCADINARNPRETAREYAAKRGKKFELEIQYLFKKKNPFKVTGTLFVCLMRLPIKIPSAAAVNVIVVIN